MDATLVLDISELRAMLKHGEEISRPACARAINRGLRGSRRPVSQMVSDFKMIRPQRLIARRIRIDKATRQHLTGTIRCLKTGIPVAKLAGARDRYPRGAGAPRHQFAHGFIRKNKRGYRDVFTRKGSARLPIKQQKVIIDHTLETAIRIELPRARDRALDRLAHELCYAMQTGAQPPSWSKKGSASEGWV